MFGKQSVCLSVIIALLSLQAADSSDPSDNYEALKRIIESGDLEAISNLSQAYRDAAFKRIIGGEELDDPYVTFPPPSPSRPTDLDALLQRKSIMLAQIPQVNVIVDEALIAVEDHTKKSEFAYYTFVQASRNHLIDKVPQVNAIIRDIITVIKKHVNKSGSTDSTILHIARINTFNTCNNIAIDPVIEQIDKEIVNMAAIKIRDDSRMMTSKKSKVMDLVNDVNKDGPDKIIGWCRHTGQQELKEKRRDVWTIRHIKPAFCMEQIAALIWMNERTASWNAIETVKSSPTNECCLKWVGDMQYGMGQKLEASGNINGAAEWYIHATNLSHHSAMLRYAEMHLEKIVLPLLTDKEVLLIYRKLYNLGVAEAAARLGEIYYNGLLNETFNIPYAAQLYKEGDKKGNYRATKQLAHYYEERTNYLRALGVYIRLANKGDSWANYMVGRYYERGMGGSIDMIQAINWYKKSTDPRAMYFLGRGLCPYKADLIERSAKGGAVEGLIAYSVYLEKTGNIAEANTMLAKAETILLAEENKFLNSVPAYELNYEAHFLMAFYYLRKGEETKAKRYCKIAHKGYSMNIYAGINDAMCYLGLMLVTGCGVADDKEMGEEFIKKAKSVTLCRSSNPLADTGICI